MKKIFALLIICACALGLRAQGSQDEGKKHNCQTQDCQTMMNLKRDFMEKNFPLKDQQKDAFWAAYEQREKAVFDIMSEQRALRKEAGISKYIAPDSIQFLTDEQITVIYRTRMTMKEKLAQVDHQFFNKLVDCLTPKQIDQYYQLEASFKRTASKKAAEKRTMPRLDDPKPLQVQPADGKKPK